MGYPSNASGNTIYYFDVNNPAWTQQAGAGVSLTGIFRALYVVGASGAIYSTPANWKNNLVITDISTNGYEELPSDTTGNQLRSYICNPTNLTQPQSVAINSIGDIFISDEGSNTIWIQDGGTFCADAPSRTISGSSTGLNGPDGIALDSSGNIYASNYVRVGAGTVTVYGSSASGNASPIRTISGSNTGLNAPENIAVDSNDYAYVANAAFAPCNSFSIVVFAPGASGNVSPVRTIAGSNTGLNCPFALTLDASGKLYVANLYGGTSGTGSVTVYAAGANGNVAPTATISGSNAAFCYPEGVAVDSSGKIYVSNHSSSGAGCAAGVAVFAAGANGNVSPIATISGGSTGIVGPAGIAINTF